MLVGASTILPALSTQAAALNLISNPSVETPDSTNTSLPQGWQQGGWGTNSASYSYQNTGHSGSRSVQVQISSYTSGDAKWYFSPVNVQSGTKYVFSDFYEASVPTDVVAQFDNGSGSYTYQDLGSAIASPTWQQYNATFTPPTSAVRVTIFHLINKVGSLTTDDFSLNATSLPTVNITSPTAGSTASGTVPITAQASAPNGISSVQFQIDGQNSGSSLTSTPYQINWDSTNVSNGTHSITAVATGTDGTASTSAPVNVNVSNTNPVGGNLIPNPLVSNSDPNNPSSPQDWTPSKWGSNRASFTYQKSGFNDTNSVSVQMTSHTTGDAKWFFTPQSVQPDTQYKYSEYYQSSVQTEVVAVFNMSDGSIVYQIIGLPDAASSWTKFTADFSIPLGTSTMTVYHLIQSVGTLTTDDFSLAPYTPVGFNRPLLSLTFDDGYVSTYNNALPLLRKNGFNSTQFIITDLIGQTGYVTKAQVTNYHTQGQEVASHTKSHSDLTKESQTTLTNELANSQTILQRLIGVPVTDLAYPYGLYNNNVINSTQKYYIGARGVEDSLNSKDNFNAYDIRVQNVFINTTTAQVADWVKQAQATNTWLVLVYHGVDADTASPIDGDEYNVTPNQLNDQLTAIKSSGITVETMQQALYETKSQL